MFIIASGSIATNATRITGICENHFPFGARLLKNATDFTIRDSTILIHRHIIRAQAARIAMPTERKHYHVLFFGTAELVFQTFQYFCPCGVFAGNKYDVSGLCLV